MEKGKFYSGLFIMIGLIVAGLQIPTAVRELKSFDRTVNVKGLCEREVKADKVIWPLSFKAAGNDLSTVYATAEAQTAKVVDFLKAGGLEESSIRVSTPSVSDKFAQEYGSAERVYRYIIKCTVTVCSSEVDKVLELRSRQAELVKAGVAFDAENSWDNLVEFKFEGLNEIKPEMIEEATKNAREVAQKFATDSNSKLGKIKTASQGTFSIENRDSNTPDIKRVRVVTSVTYYLKK